MRENAWKMRDMKIRMDMPLMFTEIYIFLGHDMDKISF